VVASVIDPPPVATAKVTGTPPTPFPLASDTFTDGAMATAEPAGALWLFDAALAIAID
jgi:hypothetical protein